MSNKTVTIVRYIIVQYVPVPATFPARHYYCILCGPPTEEKNISGEAIYSGRVYKKRDLIQAEDGKFYCKRHYDFRWEAIYRDRVRPDINEVDMDNTGYRPCALCGPLLAGTNDSGEAIYTGRLYLQSDMILAEDQKWYCPRHYQFRWPVIYQDKVRVDLSEIQEDEEN